MVASMMVSFTIVPFSFIEGFRIHDKVFYKKDGLSVQSGYGLLGACCKCFGDPIDGKEKLELEENSPINKLSMPALKEGL